MDAFELRCEYAPEQMIVALPDGTWRYPALDEDGVWAFCWPCFDAWNQLVDIVAWEIARPTRWWRRTRAVEILTDYAWLHDDRRVLMVETPDEWLSRKCQGTCILDWSIDIADAFWDCRLEPSSRRLAKQLRAALARRPPLTILAPAQ